MKGLYKDKYIIAFYDEDDYLKDVGAKIKELHSCKTHKSIHSYISSCFAGRIPYKRLYFIDVTEKHNDIFAEEDEIFLQFIKDNYKKTDKEIAASLGVSYRTYMRYKSKGTLHKLEDKLKNKKIK
jgi:hypothetical protein